MFNFRTVNNTQTGLNDVVFMCVRLQFINNYY